MSADRFAKILEETSRSFAVGIRALRGPLRLWVQDAYLLCRLFDTYEDSTQVSRERRLALLERSERLLARLGRGESLESELADWEAIHDLAGEFGTGSVSSESERELLRTGPELWRAIAEFPGSVREAFARCLRPMVVGMQSEVRAQAQGSARIRDLREVDDYCYVVAGTVGELLTELFAIEKALNVDEQIRLEAVGFGKCLQLVNIVRDFHGDRAEGRVYWPNVAPPPTALPAPASLEESFHQLEQRFQQYRALAWEYVRRIDREARADVYRFCVFPLKVAEATLRQGLDDLAWLREGRALKISRLETLKIMAEVGLGT